MPVSISQICQTVGTVILRNKASQVSRSFSDERISLYLTPLPQNSRSVLRIALHVYARCRIQLICLLEEIVPRVLVGVLAALQYLEEEPFAPLGSVEDLLEIVACG